MTLEQAIRDAVEKGGYNPKPNYYSPFRISDMGVMFHGDDRDHEFYPVNTLLMSPAFWQALGKARGWKEAPYVFQFSYLDRNGKENFEVMTINDDSGTAVAMEIALTHAREYGESKIQWFYKGKNIHQHRLIDTLASGGSVEDFFSKL